MADRVTKRPKERNILLGLNVLLVEASLIIAMDCADTALAPSPSRADVTGNPKPRSCTVLVISKPYGKKQLIPVLTALGNSQLRS